MTEARRPWWTPAGMAVGLITVYQRTLSPVMGANCRFQPSCSLYTA